MSVTFTLPAQPKSPPLLPSGDWRPEWRAYLAALDRLQRVTQENPQETLTPGNVYTWSNGSRYTYLGGPAGAQTSWSLVT